MLLQSKKLHKMYEAVCDVMPTSGLSLSGMTDAIIITTGFYREETIKRHIILMERLGYILRQDTSGVSTWYPKYKYSKGIAPVKRVNPKKEEDVEKDAEKEVDDLLKRMR